MTTTIDRLDSYLFSLNGDFEAPDDLENFYNFCIESFIENEIIWNDEFTEKARNHKNIITWKSISDKKINELFERYENYLVFISYLKIKHILKENLDMNDISL